MERAATSSNDLVAQLRSGKAMLTTEEVMALLQKTRHTICRWCRSSKIPHVRLPDNSYIFDPRSLAEWLSARRVG